MNLISAHVRAVSYGNWTQDTSSSNTSAVVPAGESQTPISKQEGFTTMEEEAQVLTLSAPPTIPPILSDPYPTQTPDQLLTKLYKISLVYWTPALSYKLPVPGCLMAVPTIRDVFKRFRYFKAGVHFEIKLNSTQFHQGALIIGKMPVWPVTQALPTTNTGANVEKALISGMDASILSAATQDSLSIDFPWTAPIEGVDTTIVGNNDSTIGTLFIRELNPLTPSQPNLPTTLPITIYARFIDIKMYGFTSQSTKSANTEAAAKGKNFDAKTIVSVGSKIARKLPVVGSAWSTIADTANYLLGTDLSRPTNTTSSQPILSTYHPEFSLAEGTQYAQLLSLYPNPYQKQDGKYRGMETSHQTVSQLAMKPMLFATTTMSVAGISTFSFTCNVLKPTLVNLTGTHLNDWLSAMALPHKYWRGGIKYSVFFNMPAYYSCRVKLYLSQQSAIGVADSGDLPSKVVDIKGDTWVDFVVPYLYTTQWRQPLLDSTTPNTYAPTLTCLLETPILGSSAPNVPVIFVNIFRAGAEDTQFAQLRGVRPGTLQAVSQCSIEQKFSAPFEGLIAGVQLSQELGECQVEQTKTVSDAVKRFSLWVAGQLNAFTQPLSFDPGIANVNWNLLGGEPYNYFSSMFRYWKGGRILLHSQAANFVSIKNDGVYITPGDGAATIFTSTTNSIYNNERVHIHWASELPFTVNKYAPGQSFFTAAYQDVLSPCTPVDLWGIPLTTQALAIAGADDFTLMYPVPFFPVDFAPLDFGPTVSVDKKSAPKTSETPENLRLKRNSQ